MELYRIDSLHHPCGGLDSRQSLQSASLSKKAIGSLSSVGVVSFVDGLAGLDVRQIRDAEANGSVLQQ